MTVKILLVTAVIMVTLMQHCASPSFTAETEAGGAKILKGHFQRKDIEQDSVFTWFKSNYSAYALDTATVRELKPLTAGLQYVIVLGTWCGDSKREVPEMYRIFDVMGVSNDDVQLIGVDRAKKSNDGSAEKLNVSRVPTLIVLKGSQEMGRIVESPRETLEYDLLKMLKK